MIEPGIHHGISASEYHADPCYAPSLSSGIAGRLLDQTPAHARLAHPRLNPNFKPQSATMEMNVGSCAHELLLGTGGGFEVSPYEDYRKKVAQEWRDDVIARRLTPIKSGDYGRAIKIVDAVRDCVARTPGAERGFMEWKGHAESVVVWDDIAATRCRAMVDWLDLDQSTVYDLKTTGLGLSDRTLQKKIAGGLDLQAAFYLRGLETVMPGSTFAWRWVFVEDNEPFEARIIEMDAATRTFGDRKAQTAILKWSLCRTADNWPGYPREIGRLSYPAWAETEWLTREVAESEAA